MRKHLGIIWGILLLILCCLSGCEHKEENMDIVKIRSEIDQLVENDGFSGCILLKDKNKNVIFSYFCGYASKEYEVKNSQDTKFHEVHSFWTHILTAPNKLGYC